MLFALAYTHFVQMLSRIIIPLEYHLPQTSNSKLHQHLFEKEVTDIQTDIQYIYFESDCIAFVV